jgi:hypothetical protein
MKKIFLVTISILFALQSFAQIISNSPQKDVSTKNVPDDAVKAFSTKFGSDVIPKWEHKGSDYFAAFEIDKVNYEAEFSHEGGWLQTTKYVTQEDLPDAVSKVLFSGDYENWTKADFAFIQKATGENMYRISVIQEKKRRSLLITPEGKITDSSKL